MASSSQDKGTTEYGNRDKRERLRRNLNKKEINEEICVSIMSSPSEGLERKAELKNQAPRSHVLMVLVFGSYCVGRIHNAVWLKLRTLYPYLNHIPKNSACEHGQNCRTCLHKSHLPQSRTSWRKECRRFSLSTQAYKGNAG